MITGNTITVEKAEEVRKLYEDSALTQREVAERTGLSSSSVGRLTAMSDFEFGIWKAKRSLREAGGETEAPADVRPAEAAPETHEAAKDEWEKCPECGELLIIAKPNFCWNCGHDFRSKAKKCVDGLGAIIRKYEQYMRQEETDIIREACQLLHAGELEARIRSNELWK